MKKTLTRVAATAGAFAAAGVAATVFKDRIDEKRRSARGEDVPFGSVHGDHQHVASSDGLSIHIEIDESDEPTPGEVTIVFLHGWMCDLDSWHFQRLALRGRVRMVFMDHRSHGRSSRSDSTNSSLDELAGDLDAVLTAAGGDGPIVLVGHSMGGMTIMNLAARHPRWFDGRVAGIVLVSTSAGRIVNKSVGLGVLATLLRTGRPVLDWGRGFNSRSVIRRWAVGPNATNLAIELTNEMILRAPSRIIADFHKNILELDLAESLPMLADTRVAIVSGTKDVLVPHRHSVWLHDQIPGSEMSPVTDAGHMVMFEEPEQVTEVIQRVLKDIA